MGDGEDPLGTNDLLSHRSKDPAVFKLHKDGRPFRRRAQGGRSKVSAANDPTCADGCAPIAQNITLAAFALPPMCKQKALRRVCSNAQMLKCSRVRPWESGARPSVNPRPRVPDAFAQICRVWPGRKRL